MTAPPKVWSDPELSDLIQHDPTLVAIADALTVAAPETVPRRRATGGPMAYTAAAAIVILAVAIPSVAFSSGLRSLLGLSSTPPVARNWVQATLTRTVPRNAPAGSTVVIRWRLWSRNEHGQIVPFDAEGLFARLVNPAATSVTTAAAQGHDGRYHARVRVPPGGIGQVQIGIMGWSTGPAGRTQAANLLPITNSP